MFKFKRISHIYHNVNCFDKHSTFSYQTEVMCLSVHTIIVTALGVYVFSFVVSFPRIEKQCISLDVVVLGPE